MHIALSFSQDGNTDNSSDSNKPCLSCCCPQKKPKVQGKRRKSVALAEETFEGLSADSHVSLAIKAEHLPLTFIPDFIIKEILNDSLQKIPYVLTSDVVICVVDVSGFTSLCESYCEKGVSGIDELASVLNGFMSTLSAMILDGGGDILNFAGDAFLVQWSSENGDLKETANSAYRCAINLQTHPCLLSKNLNGVLKIKIGIAMGEISSWILGSSDFLLFVIAGLTVPVVNKAEGLCSPGEIVLSKEFYNVLKETATNMDNAFTLDDGFMKISSYEENEDTLEPVPNRSKLFELCSIEDLSHAKTFLIPALRDIKSEEELQYLSELTMVTILFIAMLHVDVAEPKVLDKVFDIILEACKKFGGVMNKMLLFDKGCTFLVAFGLPNMKHSNDAVRGILCAESVVQHLNDIEVQVSIGITSGTCFCGMVGHPQRQEYTVIGNRVNMAARIMVVYSDQSICLNVDTYHLSRDELGHQNFVEMPARKMKGIDSAGAIYAYRKKESKKKSSLSTPAYDLSARESSVIGEGKEQARIYECVTALCTEEKRKIIQQKNLLPILIVKGLKNSGKDYLMFFSIDCATSLGYKNFLVCALPSYLNEAFFIVFRLLQRMLEITMIESSSEREHKILSALPDDNCTNLYLFNHLFQVSFPISQENIDITKRNEEFTKLAKAIMHKIIQNHCTLIAIDNADDIDDQSWYFLHRLVEEERVILVLSLSPDFIEVNVSASTLMLKASLHVDSAVCQEDIFAPVLCFIFRVKAVHKSLYLFLRRVSGSSIQLLKEISLSPVINDCIQIVPWKSISEEKHKEYYIHQLSILGEKKPLALDVKPGSDLRNILFPTNISDSVKRSLNDLSMQQRLLLKRASILGPDFDWHTLLAISQGLREVDVRESINGLLSQHVFTSACTCDFMMQNVIHLRPSLTLTEQNLCLCASYYWSISEDKHNKYEWPVGPYHRLSFRTVQLRSFVLSQMTFEQLHTIRMEVADTLEVYGPECFSCKRARRAAIEVKGLDSKDERRLIDSDDPGKCWCLEIRPKIYSDISTVYKSTEMKFLPAYFMRKSAQSANAINYPFQALNYILVSEEMLNKHGYPAAESTHQNETYFDPLVLDISLKKTRAESYMILGKYYEAATYIFKALDMLELNNICLFGVFDATNFKKILNRLPLLHAEYVTLLIGLLATLYVKVQNYRLAHDLLKIGYVAVSCYPVDFLLVLNHTSLLHCCKYWMNQPKKLFPLEKNIFSLCRKKLQDLDALLDLTEVFGIASAYNSISKINLHLGNWNRAEKAAKRAIRVLKSVDNKEMTLKTKILLFEMWFHCEKFEKCSSILEEIHDVVFGEFGCLKSLSMYRVASMRLMLTNQESVQDLQDNMKVCNNFALSWKLSARIEKKMLFYISVFLSWWCINSTWSEADKAFNICYKFAAQLYESIPKGKDDYWLLTSILYYFRTQLKCLAKQKQDCDVDVSLIQKQLRQLKNKVKLNFPIYWSLFCNVLGEAESFQS